TVTAPSKEETKRRLGVSCGWAVGRMKGTQGTRRIALAVNREWMQTWFVALTFFHSAATCLHLPARLTRESWEHEGRKPRASERHVVGCCEVLAAAPGPTDLTIGDEG